MKKLLLYLVLTISISCQSKPIPAGDGTNPPSYEIWEELLKKHVDEAGMVEYQGFIEDKEQLQSYLNTLSSTPPDPDTWSENDQIAYWINAYNAFTVKLIIDNYPVESIEELHPTVTIPTINTVWHKKFFKIGGQEFSLDEIEHKVLRKHFNEPRIHFAIVCASLSCPSLRREAYIGENLDKQLDAQASGFINDPSRNKISKDNVKISKIFSWFKGDFTTENDLIPYLNRYGKTKINPDAEISYMEYDWKLNEQ